MNQTTQRLYVAIEEVLRARRGEVVLPTAEAWLAEKRAQLISGGRVSHDRS